MVPEFWKLLPDQSHGYNSAYPPKPEIIEEFIKSVPGKTDLDLVLISACVPDTRPETDIPNSFYPYVVLQQKSLPANDTFHNLLRIAFNPYSTATNNICQKYNGPEYRYQ